MSGAARLYLMRHGTPEGAGRLLGATDAPVTAEGLAACVEGARGLPVECIVASDLTRSLDCARAIAGACDVTVDPRWRELSFGNWDGLAPSEVDAAALAAFQTNPDAAPPPGGERWSALVGRVAAALDAIDPRPTLVVAHAGSIRAALSVLCGFSYAQTWSIDLSYAVLLELRLWAGAPRRGQIVSVRPCGR